MADERLDKPLSSESDERINKRAERRKRLEQLSGFNCLTSRQQDIILASMYMQDLSDRGKRSGGFARAGRFQESWWCHNTVRNLEQEGTIGVRVGERGSQLVPPEFFDAKYEKSDVDAHVLRVKDFGYPCVVLLREAWPHNSRSPGVPTYVADSAKVGDNMQSAGIHTLVVLGEDEHGEIQVFHKDSAAPFEGGSLRGILAEHDVRCAEWSRSFWVGIRKVNCLRSVAHPGGVIEPETLLP